MSLVDEHWDYTAKTISIGVVLASLTNLKIDDTEESQQKFEQIIGCLEQLYKEAFKHGQKHELEKKL